MLEATLESAILSHMRQLNKPRFKLLFSGEGPLASLTARIRMAYALDIFSADVEKTLLLLKEIRNAFAHSLRPISFKTKEVVDACEHLPENSALNEKGQRDKRMVFVVTCIDHSRNLAEYAAQRGGGTAP